MVDLVESLTARIAAGADDDDLVGHLRSTAPLLSNSERAAVVERARRRAAGVGPLAPLMADPTVTEIMINGPGPLHVERAGRVETTDIVVDERDVALLVERICAPLGRQADRHRPIVDGRLPDGSRVNIVVPPLAVDGAAITIRRFAATTLPPEAFGPGSSAVVEAARAGRTVLVVGGTGAGKTTLLNAVAGTLDPSLRVVTIEDTAELRLPLPHVVRLEARPANAEGIGEITIRDLVRTALRMRPDRLVVGEVRGAEALDLVLALNTGHEGSLATLHATSAVGALRRLATLVALGGLELPAAAVAEQVASAVDLVVVVGRTGAGRRIVAVDEIDEHGSAVARWR